MKLEIRGAEKLSLREKQVVTFKEIGMSSEAIAKKLGISEGTVATLYGRARAKGFESVIVIEGALLGLEAETEEQL